MVPETALCIKFKTLIIVARHEVDDASDGVRPVNRGGAIRQHLDACDGAGRQNAGIWQWLLLTSQRKAMPIDQHERAVAGNRPEIVNGGGGVAAALRSLAKIGERRQPI